jgi:ATP-dependent DNA helicase PIF1
MTLNEGQQKALDTILEGHSVFLTGPGGTGKSFLIQRIVSHLEDKNKKVAVTALTGCAALLLGHGAKTIHSWAGIGLGKETATKIASDIRKLPYKNKVLRRWLTTRVLIIDEVSMMTPELLELLNDVAQLVRRESSKLFGGIQVVLVGDFCQLPPVMKPTEDDEKQELKFLFESPIWQKLNLHVCPLTQIVRQDDPVFQSVLNEARCGKLSDNSIQILSKRKDADWSSLKIRPTLLFSRRAEVDMINESNLQALEGKDYVYDAKTVFDATIQKGMTTNSIEVKRAEAKIDRDAPYKPSLTLRIGAQVMLIYNLDPEDGLVNGSRGVVVGFTGSCQPIPLILFKGRKEPIPIVTQSWESDELEGMKRIQIPLILAYAVTIHKTQGSTLDCALMDIGSSIFEVGQAYVALSRVKSLDSLYIYDLDPTAFKAHTKVVEFYKSL